MNKEIKGYYHILDFYNGELIYNEKKESSTEIAMLMTRHFLKDPIIIYGYDLTEYFINKK